MTMHEDSEPADFGQDEPFSAEAEGLAPLASDLRRLAGEAKTLVEAELAYQASRAKVAAGSAAKMALLGLSAFVLVFFALMALVFGAVLALASVLGPLAATAIVAGLFLITALACGLLLKRRARRSMALIFPKADGQ